MALSFLVLYHKQNNGEGDESLSASLNSFERKLSWFCNRDYVAGIFLWDLAIWL